MHRNIQYLSLLLLLILGSCDGFYDFPEPTDANPDPGQADYSKVIAIGSSVTAGVMDGALYNRGQQNSFVAILAEQLKQVGGGDFNLPDVNAEVGAYVLSPPGSNIGRLILRVDPNSGSVIPAPIVPGNPLQPFEGNRAEINNFGVNGMNLAAALSPQTGNINAPEHPLFNLHYARFASNPGSSTLIGDASAALADGGTFFVFWLGKNDVLPYALQGGANDLLLPSDEDFEQLYNTALNSMLQANTQAKGAVGNIPDLNSLPFFSTISWNALPLNQAFAILANGAFEDYNLALNQAQQEGLISAEETNLRSISFQPGLNGFVMEDKTLTDLSGMGIPSIRLSRQNDKVALTLATVLGETVGGNQTSIIGVTVPVGDEFVLLPQEQEFLEEKINTFNGIIQAAVAAQSERLVLVDVNDFLDKVASGSINAGSVPLTNSIIPPNGGFSVDGVHTNARANAFLANYFIDALQAKWGSSIPKVNPNAFIGNDLPR
ncbi:hypothetical protein [Cyclobacterium plantarum]|uniref:GDSL-like Lipase/Acylhydrolase n=1 Tax=Cyclobacterium plantarum TaxID=2716263 RepID=A0ABX0H791_9BACT|nr:hypothetical protein [Cyclobacterium plantarum]NHE56086.1 hypothetical protein [Cyclobacterium plantarum]